MQSDKDYYRILGVLDDAEDIVIRAAYRALAQRYHPDRWQGDAAEATRRMAEINAAYAVLFDPAKRAAYDAQRDKNQFRDDSPSDDEDTSESAAINKDWAVATKYLPELTLVEQQLKKLSHELGFTFRLTLLESKKFKDYSDVAKRLEKGYLTKYFGSQEDVQDFAKELILEGKSDAAKELNEVVRVLGVVDYSTMERIARDFNTSRFTNQDDDERVWASENSASSNLMFGKLMIVSVQLGAIVGNEAIPRHEVTKRVWDYIKRNDLLDSKNRRLINSDAKLREIFGGKKQVSLSEASRLINGHFYKFP